MTLTAGRGRSMGKHASTYFRLGTRWEPLACNALLRCRNQAGCYVGTTLMCNALLPCRNQAGFYVGTTATGSKRQQGDRGMEFQLQEQNSRDFYGFLLISMDYYGFLWISVDLYGFLWISIAFKWFLLISMDFDRFLWISKDFYWFLKGWPRNVINFQ